MYILMINKAIKCSSFFVIFLDYFLKEIVKIFYFLKEIVKIFFVFLSSYRNTRESLGELEKAVETLACGSCSHSISRSPKLPLVFL